MMTTRILIADDHQIVREGLRSLLAGHTDLEVVAEAENGRDAVRLAQELEPDMVIMDIGMPDLNGIEATRRIVAQTSGCRVLALSMHSDRRFVERALGAGASGYLLKDCAFEDLVRAVRAIMAGEVFLSPGITRVMVQDYLSRMDQSRLSVLTPREQEVLQLISEGHTTKAIAGLLHVSVKTIETHRQQIMKKLDMHNIAELTKYAIREGLTSLDP